MNREDWRRVWDSLVAAGRDNPFAAGVVLGIFTGFVIGWWL